MSDGIGSAAASVPSGTTSPDAEYRLSRRYRRPMLTRFGAMVILTVVCVLTRTAFLQVAAYVTGALALSFGALYLWQGRFATRVTGRGIEARGYFNHFLPWQDVRGIEVNASSAGRLAADEDYGSQVTASGAVYASGSLRGSGVRVGRVSPNRMAHIASIKVVRTNGRKLRLRAPVVSGWASEPDFDDKAAELDQICARYGRGAIG